jgi:iron complex outermembrane recepter protein
LILNLRCPSIHRTRRRDSERRHGLTRTLAPLLPALALLAVTGASPTALAQATAAEAGAAFDFDLPAQPLADSLRSVAQRAGLRLIAEPAQVVGLQAPALKLQGSANAAFAALLAGTALSAHSEPGAAVRIVSETRLDTVEVIGRVERNPFAESTFSVTGTQTDILDIPQSVSAVTKEVIREQGLLRLNDIAPYVAGVNEFSVYDDLTIRGFRNSDDRRVNGMRTFNNFWKQPFIAHLERVEIIKGPASAMFGDASPGGTINLVTKKPLRTARGEAELRLGSYDEKYGTVDLTGPVADDARVLYRMNAAIEDSESFRNQFFQKAWMVAPTLTWLPTDRTRLNLDIVHVDDRSVLDRGQPNIQGAGRLGVVPIEVMVTQPGDQLDTTESSVAVSGDHRLTDAWTVSTALMRYRYREKLQEHGLNFYITPSVIDLYATDRDTRADTTNAMARVAGRLTTGAVGHEVVAGVEYARREDFMDDGYTDNNTVGTFDLLNPVYSPRNFGSYTYIRGQYGGETKTTGVFVHDTLSLGAWKMLLGVRQQEYEITPLGEAPQTVRTTLPRLGLVYNVTPSASAYGVYTTGFQPPDTYANAPGRGGPFDPEKSRLLEVGWKQRAFDDRFLFTASAYEIVKRNVIIYLGFFNGQDLYAQRGEERARGIELEANGRIFRGLQVLANLAYNDARIEADPDPALVGQTKEGAPGLAGTLFARYDFPNGFGFGGGLTYISERETFQRPLQLPSYTVAKLGAYWQRDGLAMQLLVDNVTDKVHWTGGYNYGRVFPGTPRTVRLTVAYRFFGG